MSAEVSTKSRNNQGDTHSKFRELFLLKSVRRKIRDVNRGQRAFCRRGTARNLRRLCKHGVKERLRALKAAVEDSTAAFVLNSAVALDPVANVQSVDLRMLYRFRAEKISGRPYCDLCKVPVRDHYAVVRFWNDRIEEFTTTVRVVYRRLCREANPGCFQSRSCCCREASGV